MSTVYQPSDTLDALNRNAPLGEKLNEVHAVLRQRYAFVNRVAVALYDRKTDVVKTYVQSNVGGGEFGHYEAKLTEVPSLAHTVETGAPRVITDLSELDSGTREHTRSLRAAGYQASYTLPMYCNDVFFGFVFFNSVSRNPFTEESFHDLSVFGHLISLMIISELSAIRTLAAAVKTARDMAKHRDVETGVHLDRMSHYSRLIARELAPKYGLSDEYIERVFLFAPLHDIGKIGVPDNILLKPGRLTPEEFEVMRSHVTKGREIIDAMVEGFELGAMPHVDILRNISGLHHEAVDGSGYPQGLRGDEIPIEARIIAVADVFDALTSERPYKPAWSNAEAFAALRRVAGAKLDADCVDALIDNEAKVLEIQARFREDRYG
jgi:HD-GYP domain-containing protein (c-di-GMP phosphodiesterase class II)